MALRYLVACAVAGAIVGPVFGAFSRADFHFPPRLDAAPQWQQALLNALQVIEWPGLFGLTLAASLGLWRWLRPRSEGPAPSRGLSAIPILLLAAIAALIVVPLTNRPGAALAAVIAALMGALVGARLLAFWRAASAETRSTRERWTSQLPLAAGQLVATSSAALFLGYRGDSALVHGIALLIGFGLFVVDVALTLLIAVLAPRRSGHG